jgi:membrane-bound lytic murein transglycosylase B
MNTYRTFVFSLLFFAVTATAAEPYVERVEVRTFIAEMADKHGFEPDNLYALFRKTKCDPAVLKAILPPAHPGIRSWQVYRGRFVEPTRINRGLVFWNQHVDALARAEVAYGVPAEIVVAIIGVETIYGRNPGQFHVFNALTTLSFDYPPRAELFRRELEALLLLAREENRDPWSYRGSYAGAIGLPQFLPSSMRNYAVDFDASGQIDLTDSAEDAIGSVARFLRAHGWEPGETIAVPVRVAGDPAPLVAEGILPQRLPADMISFGVEADGTPAKPAALIDLVTPGAPTEYRLGYNNFYVLTRYNRSSFYATAVLDLAAALRAARK